MALEETAQEMMVADPENKDAASTVERQELKPRVAVQGTTTSASSDTPRSESTTSESLYFVRPPSGGEYGPAGKVTIELWISQRRITGETLVCLVGTSQWKKAKEVFSDFFVLG